MTELSVPAQVAHAVGRFLAVSLLFSVTAWAARVSGIHRNARDANTQRANSLAAFPALLEASEDPQARTAVIVAVTACVFGSNGIDSARTAEPNLLLVAEVASALNRGKTKE